MNGLLFSSDFLAEGIRQTRGWMQAEDAFVRFREAIAGLYGGLDAGTGLNEPQTRR